MTQTATPQPVVPPGRRGWLVGAAIASAVVVAGIAIITIRGGGSNSMAGMAQGGPAARSGASAANGKTVDLEMVDVAFRPNSLAVAAGTTVNFTFHNRGSLAHEAILGDRAVQDAHEADMAQKNGAGMDMNASGAIGVAPGKAGSLTETFSKPGIFYIGCHEPGHYASGMRATITVS